ncbi:hypothetical protein LCGC14_1505910 [marine sediment metagenome]|uniref:Radical SAM core domain-containing protein n=1 Tax=marine sediment metagenome TaxID=412755 RepID=A0A0F9J353_9ZZZZ
MVTCQICPHYCQLTQGEVGKCLVHKNIDGHIELIFKGQCSIISVEPIEKRPFFHFFPGNKFLSVGFCGCNFSCKYCQTFKISQSIASKTTFYSPNQLVELAIEKSVRGIVFTFNEPTIHYEYIMEVGSIIQSLNSDLQIVLKTNGFVNNHILNDLDIVVDAWNVDIKGGMQEYKTVCGGEISPVLSSIETLASKNTHLEISYLVLPQTVDNMEHHSTMRDWLFGLSPNIPVHLLFCYPIYRMKESYSPHDLKPIWFLFREKLNNVYISNVFGSEFAEFRRIKTGIAV